MKLFIWLGRRWFNEVKIEKNKNGIVLEIIFTRAPF
jgi:hypothetical protein